MAKARAKPKLPRIEDAIVDMIGDPESEAYTVAFFKEGENEVMFNAPVARMVYKKLAEDGYKVELVSAHKLSW
jgi:hypothetical protein